MNAARASGRASARQSARGSARASGASRDDGSAPRPVKAKKTGNQLVLCLGVILVLCISCGILYVRRSGEDAEKRKLLQAQDRAKEINEDRAFQAFMKAQSAGHEFVNGLKPDITPEALFANLQGDPNIYNVIFNWSYKKRNQNIPVQHAMRKDSDHMNVKLGPKAKVKEGINLTYGMTNSDAPIMTATKFYQPPETDKNNVNMGGEITVIVNAERQ